MGGATRAGRHQGRAVAREASDTMDARRLEGFGQGHRRQDRGESPPQHRRAGPRRAEEQHIMVTTPASASGSPRPPGVAENMLASVHGPMCEAPTSKLSGSPRPPGRGASGGW